MLAISIRLENGKRLKIFVFLSKKEKLLVY